MGWDHHVRVDLGGGLGVAYHMGRWEGGGSRLMRGRPLSVAFFLFYILFYLFIF